ncbi:HK97 family phage portal protein [Kitasatospora sp. MAA4]|uniref:phage portal protein n=1 Tax=Kitasatospora sp. MAA4 TaxID=3035093 RepID=UPI0024772BC6|nr:phage portal protein [Kitasatospora sp. MAA4]MDH6134649.1 HK97 family phage portal protein [Kitasatospora sp. MAA4]
MALFRSPPRGSREHRALTFIAPPIGAHLQAAQDYAAGSVEGSMRHAVVWKCVRLVADVISCMTPMVYRGQPGVPGAVRLPPPLVLTQPMASADINDFAYMGMVSLLLRGNAYGEILDMEHGLPTQIELQHPDRVKVSVDNDGSVTYRYGNREMKPHQVWHRMAYRMPGMHTGLSPISYAMATTRQSVSAQRFATDWFDAGGHPGGVITNANTKKLVDQDEANTIKTRFLAAARGREPVVMGGGWNYQEIKISPDESQFLATQKWTGSQLCGFFGVQPELVGESSEGSAITYANVESRSIDFLKYGAAGWIGRWERWYGALTPRGQYVRLDKSALLQGDTLTRYQAIHMLVAARIITQDEARAMLLELPPLTDQQRAEIDALVLPTPPPVGSPKIGS